MDRIRSTNRPIARRLSLLGVVLCAAAAGCGPGQTTVSGTVRCDGKPLPHGNVQFLGPDGVPHAAPIQPDGTYSLQMPAGAVKVIVNCVDQTAQAQYTTALVQHGRGAAPRPAAGKFSLIPARYADWNESGLAFDLKRGQAVQDIELTSR